MLSEIRKAINALLYERTSSPLFGAFLISWLALNWKFIYYLFAVSSETLYVDRISYIKDNFLDGWHIIWFPLISTVFLIIVYPFISTGAYWINLRFNKWKYELKCESENSQMLTFEKSIELRLEMSKQQELFAKLERDKNQEIEDKDRQIGILTKRLSEAEKEVSKLASDLSKTEIPKSAHDSDYKTFKSNADLFASFNKLVPLIERNTHRAKYNKPIGEDFMRYFISNNIIEEGDDYEYKFTGKGRYFLKRITDEQLGMSDK